MTGRAWPSDGRGGTLSTDGTGPGPYYVLAADGQAQVGSAGKESADILERAVWYAVRDIQRCVNRTRTNDITVDGLFGPVTDEAVRKFQTKRGLTVDGAVGRQTVEALILPLARKHATDDVPECLILGLLAHESAMDLGAVGYVDDHDLGIAQINGAAHPTYTEGQRFNPNVAVEFVVNLVGHNLAALDGNRRDAVAAYNLGVGGYTTKYKRTVGARGWIEDGRPDRWTPPGQYTARDVKGYIDQILSSCP